MAAAIYLFWNPTAVVDQQADDVTSRLQLGQQIAMGRRDVVARVDKLSVDIEPCGFGALQEKLQRLLFPRFGNDDFTLVPSLAFVRKQTRQMGGLVFLDERQPLLVGVQSTRQGDNGCLLTRQLKLPFTTQVHSLG